MIALLAVVLAAPIDPGIDRVANAAGTVTPAALASVRITLNGGDYSPGDEVRVQVEPGDDGYLIVFKVDGDGRVRVLFPLDPDLDPYVRGGRRYEIRGRGERHTFLADDRGGSGIIYAALASDPLAFDDFAVDDHWDYEALRLRDPQDDPEAELAAFVRRMTRGGRFDFDAVGYRVYDAAYAAGGGYNGYDPYVDCLACGYPLGGSINVRIGRGYGWYDPYDPWFYGDAGYNYYRYGYGHPYGYRYGGWSPWGGWYDPYRPIVVYPTRPRVTPDSPYGYRSRAPQALAGVPSSFAPDLGRNVRPAPRPLPAGSSGATYDGRSRVRNTTPQTSRPSSTRRGEASAPRQPTREPQRETQREPQRETRPAERPASPPPAPSNGGYEGRSRRPNGIGDVEVKAVPAVDRQETTQRPVVRETSRPVFRDPPRAERNREPEARRPSEPVRERPVYREPPRTERPVSREAPRVERPVERRAPPQRSERPVERPAPQRAERQPERQAPPQRVERPAPQREAPSPGGRSRRPN